MKYTNIFMFTPKYQFACGLNFQNGFSCDGSITSHIPKLRSCLRVSDSLLSQSFSTSEKFSRRPLDTVANGRCGKVRYPSPSQ